MIRNHATLVVCSSGIPDSAKCCADDEERNPMDIINCPLGNDECSGDCEYYME